MNIKAKLIFLANHLDNKGLYKEASFLDNIIKSAQVATEQANRKRYFDTLSKKIAAKVVGQLLPFESIIKTPGYQREALIIGISDVTSGQLISGSTLGVVFKIEGGDNIYVECHYDDEKMLNGVEFVWNGKPIHWDVATYRFLPGRGVSSENIAALEDNFGGIDLWSDAMLNAPEIV